MNSKNYQNTKIKAKAYMIKDRECCKSAWIVSSSENEYKRNWVLVDVSVLEENLMSVIGLADDISETSFTSIFKAKMPFLVAKKINDFYCIARPSIVLLVLSTEQQHLTGPLYELLI